MDCYDIFKLAYFICLRKTLLGAEKDFSKQNSKKKTLWDITW